MTYEGARNAFAAAADTDPDCAMAYWGQAMSYIHPLWSDPPSEEEFAEGQEMLDLARERGEKTDWEKAYIAAAEGYYAPGHSKSERDNLANFETGWALVHGQFPQDTEAASFYALSHLANADPSDKSYERQERAAEIARQVLEREPDHPGAHHYIIHAYDYPPLAENGLDVARSYSDIAPAVPHALHMASHIFTRLGYWPESIDMNARSAEAALEQSEGGEIPFHYLHAIDYLVYARLQRGEDQQAEQAWQEAEQLDATFEDHVASAYTFAAVPARLALERQQWEQAASLEPRVPGDYPWDKVPAMEAITWFAKALGAAHSNQPQTSQEAVRKLTEIHQQLADQSDYWAKQVEIQQLAAQAWQDYLIDGQQQKALSTMQKAADLEASTEKHPVTPGEVLPAQELLADMLLDIGRYHAAQNEYQAALKRSPNRLNSLYGMARAAEMAGDYQTATRYYRQLLDVTADDAKGDRLLNARTFLGERQ
ncbi:hypothetical protein F6455_13870 [Proteobacteria bacterium 005FR1]|nr:hypothetical protein [Proteobacteria bacterium 005FR1]